MKVNKFSSLAFASVFVLAVAVSCGDEEGVTYTVADVSSRITGFGSDVIGPGAQLTVNGTTLDQVQRICVQNSCVPAKLFNSVTESTLTFTVPTGVALGSSDVLFVFPGADRAYKTITVVALPAISSLSPTSAIEGETITIVGTNMDIVTDVRLGTLTATITSKTATTVKFTLPAGHTTSKVQLISTAGIVTSTADLVACPGGSAADCTAGLNLNFSFEGGSGNDFDSWAKFNGADKMLATTNPGEVFRGTRALRVIRDGTLNAADHWRIQMASAFVPVDNGASYTVTAWVRASVAGATMRFSNQDAAQYGPDTAVPVNWTRISWTFTANATQKRIVLDMNGGPITNFFIDDVKIIKN